MRTSTTIKESTGYSLIMESFPSIPERLRKKSNDKYSETCTTRLVLGTYEEKGQAIEAAKLQRTKTSQFDNWGNEFFGDDPPPYHSVSRPKHNFDEDEDVSIFIQDNGVTAQAQLTVIKGAKTEPPPAKKAKVNYSNQPFAIGTKIIKPFDGVPYNGAVVSYDVKSKFYKIKYDDGDSEELDFQEIKRYAKEKSTNISNTKTRKFGPVGGKITNVAKIDNNIFLRNPCRIPGGKQNSANVYGNCHSCKPINSYYYLVQRLSDRNYAMRGHCVDGNGVQYASFKKARIVNRCVAFLPETNLDDHCDNPHVVDACHLDMICPVSGECFLTTENMLDAIKTTTECIFLNGYQFGGVGGSSKKEVDPGAIVKAINNCKKNLLCFSLTESVLTNEILFALSKCKKLKGLTISMTQNYGGNDSSNATDYGLKMIIEGCHDLRWLFVEESTMLVRDGCWKALDTQRTCTNLEVLWCSTQGDHELIQKVVRDRSSTLKLCMINHDEKLKSRYLC